MLKPSDTDASERVQFPLFLYIYQTDIELIELCKYDIRLFVL
jgi:hypothetical protein